MDIVFKELIQNIPTVLYRCTSDESWTMHFINDAIQQLCGYPASDFIQNKVRTYASIVHPDDIERVVTTVNTALEAKEMWELEYLVVHQDGSVKWVSERGIGIYSQTGKLEFLDGVITDINNQKETQLALLESQNQVHELAYFDSLTGLANRNLFGDRLNQVLAMSQRNGEKFSLMFMDLDKFKAINDTHGHFVGDKLLGMVAKRITSMSRKSDTVARYGGDEFLFIAINTPDYKTIESLAEKIVQRLAEPYDINGLTLEVTCSIGIVLSPEDGKSKEELLNNADSAMYQAKLRGKNQVSLYDINK